MSEFDFTTVILIIGMGLLCFFAGLVVGEYRAMSRLRQAFSEWGEKR